MLVATPKTRIAALVILGLSLFAVLTLLSRLTHRKPIVLTGAVIREESDMNKERPIADVAISTSDDQSTASATSDASGFFRISLIKGVKSGQLIALELRRSGYFPQHLNIVAGDRLCVVRMIPLPQESNNASGAAQVVVSNVRVRYSVSSAISVNIGSAVKTFQISNTGNVACNFQPPCSPDGKWKAAVGSVSVDAGAGNQFHNARASCIAGPCPFTRIEPIVYTEGDRIVKVSARNWSENATFLVEAEVFHGMETGNVRESYPVIFGQALNFTLPSSAQGVSIEAEIDRTPIVFPIGPDLLLSWGECEARTNSDQTRVYRCELKPGYRF